MAGIVKFVCRLVCVYLAMYVHLHMHNANANSISEDCKSHLQQPYLLLNVHDLNQEDNIVLSFYKWYKPFLMACSNKVFINQSNVERALGVKL